MIYLLLFVMTRWTDRIPEDRNRRRDKRRAASLRERRDRILARQTAFGKSVGEYEKQSEAFKEEAGEYKQKWRPFVRTPKGATSPVFATARKTSGRYLTGKFKQYTTKGTELKGRATELGDVYTTLKSTGEGLSSQMSQYNIAAKEFGKEMRHTQLLAESKLQKQHKEDWTKYATAISTKVAHKQYETEWLKYAKAIQTKVDKKQWEKIEAQDFRGVMGAEAPKFDDIKIEKPEFDISMGGTQGPFSAVSKSFDIVSQKVGDVAVKGIGVLEKGYKQAARVGVPIEFKESGEIREIIVPPFKTTPESLKSSTRSTIDVGSYLVPYVGQTRFAADIGAFGETLATPEGRAMLKQYPYETAVTAAFLSTPLLFKGKVIGKKITSPKWLHEWRMSKFGTPPSGVPVTIPKGVKPSTSLGYRPLDWKQIEKGVPPEFAMSKDTQLFLKPKAGGHDPLVGLKYAGEPSIVKPTPEGKLIRAGIHPEQKKFPRVYPPRVLESGKMSRGAIDIIGERPKFPTEKTPKKRAKSQRDIEEFDQPLLVTTDPVSAILSTRVWRKGKLRAWEQPRFESRISSEYKIKSDIKMRVGVRASQRASQTSILSQMIKPSQDWRYETREVSKPRERVKTDVKVTPKEKLDIRLRYRMAPLTAQMSKYKSEFKKPKVPKIYKPRKKSPKFKPKIVFFKTKSNKSLKKQLSTSIKKDRKKYQPSLIGIEMKPIKKGKQKEFTGLGVRRVRL